MYFGSHKGKLSFIILPLLSPSKSVLIEKYVDELLFLLFIPIFKAIRDHSFVVPCVLATSHPRALQYFHK